MGQCASRPALAPALANKDALRSRTCGNEATKALLSSTLRSLTSSMVKPCPSVSPDISRRPEVDGESRSIRPILPLINPDACPPGQYSILEIVQEEQRNAAGEHTAAHIGIHSKLRLAVAWASRECLRATKAASVVEYSQFLQKLLAADTSVAPRLQQLCKTSLEDPQLSSTMLETVMAFGPSDASVKCSDRAVHLLAIKPCLWAAGYLRKPALLVQHLPTRLESVVKAVDAVRVETGNPLQKSASHQVQFSSIAASDEAKPEVPDARPAPSLVHKLSLRLARLLSVLDSSHIMMTVCTPGGKVVYQNSSSVDYAGMWQPNGDVDFFEELFRLNPELYENAEQAWYQGDVWGQVIQVPSTLTTVANAHVENSTCKLLDLLPPTREVVTLASKMPVTVAGKSNAPQTTDGHKGGASTSALFTRAQDCVFGTNAGAILTAQSTVRRSSIPFDTPGANPVRGRVLSLLETVATTAPSRSRSVMLDHIGNGGEANRDMYRGSLGIKRFKTSLSADATSMSTADSGGSCPAANSMDQAADTQIEAWHDVFIVPFLDPETSQQMLLVAQSDVTERSKLEQSFMHLLEMQLYMLENLFPRHILERMARLGAVHGSSMPVTMPTLMKELGQATTHHECVTIMFTDIVGFTNMSKEVQPEQVMSLLNELFSKFDSLVGKHGVYKVETAGDCYIVCAGLLDQDADGFRTLASDANMPSSQTVAARRVLNFAADMLNVAKTVMMPNDGQPVRQRVGVHTGPVVSGLIGQLQPKFNLFGDTMNTASRMESTSKPGRIQVSEATYQLLKDPGKHWECTGGVEVKGKGVMNTYFLEERLSNASTLYAARTVMMPNDGQPVRQRVGVHTGPVVSGLIGQLQPKFNLFGDTMNTASRMESTSKPGRIQVSEATYQLLKDPGKHWECTGGVEVKGKGVMNTYLLEERLSNASTLYNTLDVAGLDLSFECPTVQNSSSLHVWNSHDAPISASSKMLSRNVLSSWIYSLSGRRSMMAADASSSTPSLSQPATSIQRSMRRTATGHVASRMCEIEATNKLSAIPAAVSMLFASVQPAVRKHGR